MGLLELLLKKKKKEEKKEIQVVKEDTGITMMRDLLEIKYGLNDLKRAMHEDHHRILDEFETLPRKDEFHKALGDKIEKLKKEKIRIETELEMTELQKKIIEGLANPKSAAELAQFHGKSRTWMSQQMSKLSKLGMVSSRKEGRSVKYFTPDIGQPGTSEPPQGAP